MHKILTSEVNPKFVGDVSFLFVQVLYLLHYSVLKPEPFKSHLRLLVRMNVSMYVSEHVHTFYRTALSFTKINIVSLK